MENKEEIWKDILNFEGIYQISNLGRVKSLKRTILDELSFGRKRSYDIKEKILKQTLGTHNYYTIGLYITSKRKIFRTNVHRLIAIAFIPNPNKYPFVNHINSIRTDNSIENLEWCTAKQNTYHAIINNRMNYVKGEKSFSAKLKNSDINKIKELKENGFETKHIASIFSVSGTTIRQILTNKSWKHLL